MASNAAKVTDQPQDTYIRSSDVRYGAHCPGVVELIFKDRKHYIALTGVIVNLSVTGCLFSNDQMPWAGMDADSPLESIFDVIDERCRIYIPWINTHAAGKIRRIGFFIIGVEFDKPLSEVLVKSTAMLEPNRERRFKPRRSGKYNRVLPLVRG
jgi:hypothetical protein